MKSALLLACMAVPLASAQDFAVQKYGDILVFDGAITPAAYEAINATIDDGVDLMLVRSIGGDAASGLAIGKKLRDRNITVVVNEYCLSACANYIFIGPSRKSLNPGAVLGFHGGLTGSPAPTMAAEDYPLVSQEDLITLRKQMARLYDEETAFYARIGFDPALLRKSFDLTRLDATNQYIALTAGESTTFYSFAQADEARRRIAALAAEHASYTYRVENSRTSATRFYFPSLATLRNAGVTGVQNYPYPADVRQLRTVEQDVGRDLPGLNLASDI
ncbi:hypothetical protein FHW58_001156 [Duganella sp. 1224]|uniref:hypothetical protein n=1 Tax=Duganella sp. 1224 TaxID=2587052 RepID=UPI0015CC38FB|nr:hypothetical protein [Duganella sp. 1224]NYE60004.1 hypothetical protein [Duganella sp. 1224]